MEGKLGEKPKSYVEATREAPPSEALVSAVELVLHKDKALELGAGALRDVKFLRQKGFAEVVAVDKDPNVRGEVERLSDENVHAVISSFEDFDFPQNTFDLINAQNSLPFVSEESFKEVFKKVKDSLKEGGVFVGKLLGANHAWKENPSASVPEANFHTLDEVRELLKDMQVIDMSEKEGEVTTAVNKRRVYWHSISFTARK